ncbi:hypothetical protein HDU93_001805 [Gonapodya sp. JEL0774]|nr:hypothetical protein HDU93_001805 [Gonapodya sp. JEL0774]
MLDTDVVACGAWKVEHRLCPHPGVIELGWTASGAANILAGTVAEALVKHYLCGSGGDDWRTMIRDGSDVAQETKLEISAYFGDRQGAVRDTVLQIKAITKVEKWSGKKKKQKLQLGNRSVVLDGTTPLLTLPVELIMCIAMDNIIVKQENIIQAWLGIPRTLALPHGVSCRMLVNLVEHMGCETLTVRSYKIGTMDFMSSKDLQYMVDSLPHITVSGYSSRRDFEYKLYLRADVQRGYRSYIVQKENGVDEEGLDTWLSEYAQGQLSCRERLRVVESWMLNKKSSREQSRDAVRAMRRKQVNQRVQRELPEIPSSVLEKLAAYRDLVAPPRPLRESEWITAKSAIADASP